MNSNSQIKKLIETEINRNNKIGFIKDDFFYIPLYDHSTPISNCLLIFPVFLIILSLLANIKKGDFIEVIIITLICIILGSISHIIFYNYLVLNINDLTFYKTTYLFNRIKIFNSNDLDHIGQLNKIKLISKIGKNVFDEVFFIDENYNLIKIDSCNFNLTKHQILIERFRLLSSCLDISFITDGDLNRINNILLFNKIVTVIFILSFTIFIFLTYLR